MSEPRKLRCYGYVNRGYEEVRDILLRTPLEPFQHATSSAAERAQSIVTTLRIGEGLVVGVDVKIELGSIERVPGPAGAREATRVHLKWRATQAASLFPSMQAVLVAWPLSATETQLEIDGSYQPPFGVVGEVVDAAIGHAVAEAAVKRLLDDFIEQLRVRSTG